MTIEKMYNAFKECISVPYTTVENDASFYHEKRGDLLRLFFEPSNGKTDWRSNFDFPTKPYRDMENKWRCHRGFLKVWRSAEPYLKEHIMDPEIKRVEIVGFSHGGAIALLCHEYVKFNRPDVVVHGVGFGAPRVLWGRPNDAVMKRFDGFITVRNWNDIVTKVPPRLFGFRQAGGLLVMKVGTRLGGIKSHYPANYLASLRGLSE